MTTTPSLKNVSVAQLQDAIARALCEVTGWGDGTVTIDSLQFVQASAGESARLQLSVALFQPPDQTVPF